LNTTTKCQHCGNEVVLPFKCSYCNGYFCAEHRLPENHACPEAWKAKVPREEKPPIIVEKEPTKPSYKYTITYLPPKAKVFWFSTAELKHLTLGTFLVMGVGLSYIPYIGLTTVVSLAIAFTLSFLLHELAHKFSAQHFGLWAEFRLTMQGALITLLSMLLPLFKIISPGAVMIAGPATKETTGKTALSGPLTNIIISAICVMIVMTIQNSFFWTITVFVAWINAFIAFFNLIPFGVMDGLKVFLWNRIIWIAIFFLSVALMIIAYPYLPY